MWETAFDLSLSIDAHLDSFGHTGERAVDGVTTGVIGLGELRDVAGPSLRDHVDDDEHDHRVGPAALRRRRATQGPFRSFRHEHRFQPVDGGTTLLDHVEFEAPFGLLGRAVERLVLARYLRHLIAVRNTFLVTEATRISVGRGGGHGG